MVASNACGIFWILYIYSRVPSLSCFMDSYKLKCDSMFDLHLLETWFWLVDLALKVLIQFSAFLWLSLRLFGLYKHLESYTSSECGF